MGVLRRVDKPLTGCAGILDSAGPVRAITRRD
jgi:hypothetical protein